jgi:hypothetical protein
VVEVTIGMSVETGFVSGIDAGPHPTSTAVTPTPRQHSQWIILDWFSFIASTLLAALAALNTQHRLTLRFRCRIVDAKQPIPADPDAALCICGYGGDGTSPMVKIPHLTIPQTTPDDSP